MYGSVIFKRLLSDSQRKGILLDCLNNRIDNALKTIRLIPPGEMDYSILQTLLARSCHWGHMEAVSHIWYKYVRREEVLVVSARLLCDIGTLALNEGKYHLPKQLHYHFKKFYSRNVDLLEFQRTEYELLRLKVESFAKGTLVSSNFREKWKVFLEDIDHYFPKELKFSIRDYTYLTKSLLNADDGQVLTMLFTEGYIEVKNESTLPLLLNMILLQSRHHIEFKFNLFQKFHQLHPTLSYGDTLVILFRQCELAKDGYRMNVLIEYVRKNHMPQLSPSATRIFRRGIEHTNYAFDTDRFSDLLSDTSHVSLPLKE